MANNSVLPAGTAQTVRGKVFDALVKVSVDAARPLPLACALYAVEAAEGFWLCAYYGANRSVFDYLPQKGEEIDEAKLGITFHTKQFILRDRFQTSDWENFKKANFMGYGGHGE
jgi:hypothetical protein